MAKKQKVTNEQLLKDLYSVNFEQYKERRRLEQILLQVSEVVFCVDQNYRLTVFNKSSENVFNLSADDVIGKKVDKYIFLYKADSNRVVNYKSIFGKNSSRYIHDLNKRHLKVLSDSSSSDYYRINVSAIDYGDRKKEYVVTLTNVTDEVTLDKQKDEFISVASHELKTPILIALNNLWMFLHNSKELKLDDKQNMLLTNVKDGLVRLQKIVNELLDISRISEGRITVELEEFDMTALIEESLANFVNLITSKNLKLKKSLQLNLKVKADKFKTREILDNLISNAVKYTEKGAIEVSLEEDDNMVKVMVSDTGSGISERDRSKLFTKFGRGLQGQKMAKLGGSTGLGLYIAKNYVEKMSGKIGFTSKPDQGSIFWFTLPKA